MCFELKSVCEAFGRLGRARKEIPRQLSVWAFARGVGGIIIEFQGVRAFWVFGNFGGEGLYL